MALAYIGLLCGRVYIISLTELFIWQQVIAGKPVTAMLDISYAKIIKQTNTTQVKV